MNFNSGAFLLFLPIVVTVHWLLPHRMRKYWLLAASYFFYMYANPALIGLLLLSTAVDYACSLGMERNRGSSRIMKFLLMISICMNLGLLFTFKYFDFFAANINQLCAMLSLPYCVPQLGLILPIGISFYTFQTMSYTIDVYRGKFHAEKDPVMFALYVAYFPQLVAGPIEAPGDLMPQLKAEHSFSQDDMAAGFRLLLCGFFRKCVVADLCGIYVNHVFADIYAANTLAVAGAGALFCIQMYCDFAGYSEIAAGCARMLGVRLTRNFNRPYLSQSYTEFFRRWHISLNRWFTQYVYIPLGGNRRGRIVKMRNTVIVFALCGLWHGANWTYVLWGLYAAFFVCLESLLLPRLNQAAEKYGVNLENPMIILARRLLMFFIFIPAALLFRAQSLGQIGEIITVLASGMLSVNAGLEALGLNGYSLLALLLIIVTMNRLHVWSEFDLPAAPNASVAARRDAGMVLMTLTVILSWLALLATQDAAGFAYFQF